MSLTHPDEEADAISATSLGRDAAGANPSKNPAAFLAPSDFLPALPPSTHTPPLNAQGPDEGVEQETHVPVPRFVDAQGSALNPRSCITCRKRKVKCDKLHPCSNCNRAHIECVFPAPGRAPRKSKKVSEGRDKELLVRLRRLEGVVKGMGVDVDVYPKENEGEKDNIADRQARMEASESASNSPPTDLPFTSDSVAEYSGTGLEKDFADKTKWVEAQQQGRFEHRFGRLVVNEGKSRYINNSFWANLSNEVEDLKGILNQSSDDEGETFPRSQTHVPSSHHGFVFGFSSHNVDILSLHPLPNQIPEYWSIFKDRVDPLLKVLHLPSLEPTVLSSASHLPNLSRGFECLLFAIYYGATTSLGSNECLSRLGENKEVLLSRYRFALEQALARANFLTTEELIVLQAFVIFLICLRRNNDARVIWTLTGLVVRIAQTIGIHRDGSHFDLAPFEIEMRRRLWWQVCILDTRASEDHGCDPTIVEQSFDTKLPLNVNDSDLTPGMKQFPSERVGGTDMSFCLLRFEVANTFRRLNYIPPGPPKQCTQHPQSITLQDKERWITECHQRIEEQFLKHCDMSVPLFWVTATVARLMMSKMWLIVYHPFQRQDGGATLSEEVKHKLFITSLENMEYSVLLETDARTKHWGWLFKTYIQWHALAFTLSELCHRTTGDLVGRAWMAVEKICEGKWAGQHTEENNTGHLWRPLKKLYRKAKAARNEALLQEQQKHGSGPIVQRYSPNENPMFKHPKTSSMTRAPLSSAQLNRFSGRPSFGQTPGDAHKLLRSPRASEAEFSDASITAGKIPPWDSEDAFTRNGMDFSMASNTDDTVAAKAGQQFEEQQDFPVGTSLVDISNFQTSLTNDGNAQLDDMMLQTSPLDIHENDLSIMDTSGDLNWENWDQLVRQFGQEDGDATAMNAAGNTIGQYWAGPQWGSSLGGDQSRGGMAMGGDWF